MRLKLSVEKRAIHTQSITTARPTYLPAQLHHCHCQIWLSRGEATFEALSHEPHVAVRVSVSTGEVSVHLRTLAYDKTPTSCCLSDTTMSYYCSQ